MTRTNKRGFTLVEILIVVIPQFTNASTDARRNSTSSLLHTLRSQIELYKLQHGDILPPIGVGTSTNWTPLTLTSTYGNPVATFGPYMQQVPKNPLNSQTAVLNGDGTAAPTGTHGFVYDLGTRDAATGKYSGTGKIWATGNAVTGYFNEGNPAGADLTSAPN